jgi:predicted anti-sigma-YlaC factor YlaD
MECRTIREACSALLDGEDAEIATTAVTDHLHSCVACRQFVEDARALRQAIRPEHPDAPDLSARILAAAREQRHPRLREVTMLRLGLVAVAVAQLALAVPGLVYGNDDGAPIHVAHEVGAWDLALAVGFLFAAWRPLRAVGLLPFVGALSAGLVLTAVVDVVHGRAVALTETTHLLELLGTVLLWMLASPRPVVRRELQVV